MTLANFKSAQMLRPMPNIGCLFDIMTGRYYPGKDGEMILNGGLPNFNAMAGLPNMFKTVISLYQQGAVMERYSSTVMTAHDSENTLSMARIVSTFERFPGLAGLDLEGMGRLHFSDATVYIGNEWFDDLKTYSGTRKALPDKERLTTPFYDHRRNTQVKMPSITLSFLDSLSGLQTDLTQKMFDNAEVGESDLNMIAMRGGSAKSQIVEQLTAVTSPAAIFATITAHVGEKAQLNPKQPNIKKLKFLKGDLNLKRVPENFTFLSGCCWYCANMTVLLDDQKKPEFPRDANDDLKGDTDLIAITIVPLRNKFGPSGIPFDIVVSQSEGVKVGLTEYYHLKAYNYYGLSDAHGNSAKGKQHYRLDLFPEVSLSRTTIRRKVEENAQLARALTITAEMCQMRNLWHHLEEGVVCSPKELYDDIKAKGYDWSILLGTTRGFWTFEEDNHPLNFLSTMDLLRMRRGEYHPKWYPTKKEELSTQSAKASK